MSKLLDTIVKQRNPEYEKDVDNFKLWRAAITAQLDAGKTRQAIARDPKIKSVHPEARSVVTDDYSNLDNWLYRFELESDWSYQQRLLLSHDFGDSGRIIRSYVGHLARANHFIEFDLKDETINEKVYRNIDNADTSLQVFESEIAAEILGMGKCWILVKADEAGIPYSEIIPREDVLDWEYDSNGNLLFVKYRDTRSIIENFKRVVIDQIKLIYDQEVIIAEKRQDETNRSWKMAEPIPNPLGKIPIVDIWYGDEARPIIETVAKIQVNLFNLDSELRQLIRNQCLSILQLPQGGKDALQNLSANSFFEVTATNADVAKWISYPGSSLDPQFRYLDWLIKRIVDAANVRNKEDMNISGLSKQWDFLETETILSILVDSIAPGMKQIIDFMYEWRGLVSDSVYEIEKVFDIKKLSEKLDQIIKAMSIGLGPTAEENLRQQLVDEMVKADDEQREQITKELEELKTKESNADEEFSKSLFRINDVE
jgi:hypothetical protein